MSSPGSVRVRKSEPIEWLLVDLLDPQKRQAYPASYDQARRPLVSYLLSMTATLVVEEREQTAVAIAHDVADDRLDPQLRDRPGAGDTVITDTPVEEQDKSIEFSYVSSFDRLTSRKPINSMQPAHLSVGTHVRKVLRVTAVLSIGALAYAWVASGFPKLSTGVRSFMGDQAAKVLLILPRHDGSKTRTAPPPTPKDVNAASDHSGRSGGDASDARLLYGNGSIAFMPLK